VDTYFFTNHKFAFGVSLNCFTLLNPLMTAVGWPFFGQNRQPVELESCSNPLRIQQVI